MKNLTQLSRPWCTALMGAFVIISAVCVGGQSWACVHPGGGAAFHQVKVEHAEQEAIIIHVEGRQELILEVKYQAAKELPSLGWVIPVPSIPDRYQTADRAIFSELRTMVDLHRVMAAPRGARSTGSTKPPTKRTGLLVLPPAKAGPYTIHPLKVTGDEGAAELNAWMVENGFAPIKEDVIAYYTKRGWYFLAIRIDAAKDEAHSDKQLGRKGSLSPLHISFESERAVYPMKLANRSGSFPATIYLLTDKEVPREAFDGALARGFEVAGHRADGVKHIFNGDWKGALMVRAHKITAENAPGPLSEVIAKSVSWKKHARFYLRVLHQEKFNTGAGDPSTWTEDLAIPSIESKGILSMGAGSSVEEVKETPVEEAAAPEAGAEELRPRPAFEPMREQVVLEEAEHATQTKKANASKAGCAAATGSSPPGRLEFMFAFTALLGFGIRRRLGESIMFRRRELSRAILISRRTAWRIIGLGLAALLLVTVTGVVISLPAEAAAQASERDKQARELWRVGRERFDAGDFLVAAESFRRAYELSGRTEFLFNIGLAYWQGGALDEAEQAFRDYLTERPDAANRTDVLARIDRIEKERKAGPIVFGLPTKSSEPSAAPEPVVRPGQVAQSTPEPVAKPAPTPTPVARTIELDPAPAEPRVASAPVAQPTKGEPSPAYLTASPQPTAFALVIGVEKYRSIPAPDGARADAEKFARMLHTTMGVPQGNIRLLFDSHATRSDILAHTNWLQQNVPPNSRIYFYFSGHGSPNPETGATYILPFEATPEMLADTAVELATVLERLGQSQAREVLAFVDSCFSGTGGRSLLPKGTRPLVPVQAVGSKPKVALFSASAASQISGNVPGQDVGLFTHYVLEGLGHGRADIDGDGQISLAELQTYVTPRVARVAHTASRNQTPQLAVADELGDSNHIIVTWGLPLR